ncbi:S-layer homology domain-containing protein [Agathobaculum butyriciproducens]|uniref:S-layer homology domain-containing protein n=1 Tax=Agathobaculum butyriciproducens TaxID=1628085 RepID=A0AAW4VZL1_9FIRM|nr:S-layer homology domain-containing protein [Agathobaculum butyriciproducens]
MKTKLLSWLLTLSLLMTMLPTAAFAADGTSENTYEVSTAEELSTELTNIEASAEDDATIVLKKDVTLSNDATSGYISSFGAKGKHITVKSDEGEMKKLSFPSYGVLTGDCTFDNVNVTGSRLFCNGYRTIFTENGQIHLSETLYGGGYKTTVDSTYVVIAANGSINPTSYGGLHDVIGGSYQGSVEGDTYLEITGDIQMQSGNHLNPGCMKGDGSSGDSRDVPDVYVGGNATLIYDNKNSTDTASPAIEGTYGCEMKGDVTLDVRAGCVAGIVGTEEPLEKSIIRGNLHIIAGNPAYENTDRILRLGSNWPIVGAGNSFATYPGVEGNYTVGGNITIDTYENAWAWDKGTTPDSYDLPEIYGALRGNVGGNITINAHGSHVQNIFGASDSVVQGSVTVNATDVELKNSEYETDDDEGYIFGLWERGIPATAKGPVTVTVNGGDVGLVMATDQETVPAGSSINVTGKPKIRTGIRGTQARSYSTDFPVANIYNCEATIPYIKMMSQVNVRNNSNVTAHIMSSNAGLMVEEGSTLTTDNGQVWIWGDTVINGTWEQLHSQTDDYNDIFVNGTTQIGSNGHLINHGTSNLSGAVTNNGVMALMGPAYLQNDYTATNGELRLPAVAPGANYDTGTIPVQIKGLSTGTTTVNTVDPADWQTLKKPALGDNYILSKKNTDSPAQNVFVLGNADAVGDGWFLKRMADADGTDDYYMWQVANGVRVIFDKNGGDTEADPRIMVQDKVVGAANHFDLPTTEPTRSGYLFNGWNTKADGTGDAFTAKTDVTSNMTVYAQWKPDEAYAVKIAPMNLTVYVGGDGYHGVIGQDGKFDKNDLPEIGFYITLPDDINTKLGGTDEKPVDLSDKLRLTPVDDNGTMRSWSLELYSDESKSHVMENGRRVYVYKLRQIDDGEETVPRVQFTGADGSVMTESKFQALLTDQFRNYKISVYQGLLDEQIYKATFTTADGKTFTRPIKLGTGTLKVRGNNDTTYRAIENNTIPSVNPQEKDIMLVSTAQTDTQYYINNSGISVPSSDDVKLMVDHSLDDALLSAYINRTSNTEGKYSYQFRYLDLVDTSNGNTYVTMGAGQKMNLYWPVPSDAKSNSEFHIIHFKGIDRDSDADVNDLLTTRIPENLTCEKVTINGQQFIKFTTDSFSPFALLYEKAASSGGGYSSGGGSSSSKYTLHYESNGGTSYKDESYSSGTTVTLDKAPVRESYTFTGWYSDKELTTKISSIKMTGNKTVYAGWEATGVPDMLNGDDHYAYVVGYSDGTVRPNANISRAEVATIFFRLLKEEVRDGNLTAENTFADVTDGQWHNKAISTMAKLGVVKGRNAEAFDPDASITRAEFAAICARFNTKPVENSGSFSDISGHWAENEIERAAAFGWISGYPDGTFRPDARITRAEAMTMINRVLCRMPQSKSDLLDSMVTWPDNKPSDWHYLAVQEATNSHDFNRQGEVGESWTKLTSVPDWTRYQ